MTMATGRTHQKVDPRWSGAVLALGAGEARLELLTREEMAADDRGLVHGGFVFSLADHAAMLAVNEPTVVLVAAEVRYLRPVRVGERLVAEARLGSSEGRRRQVRCTVQREGEAVFEGELTCHVPSRHVLEAPPEGPGGGS
jgi:uncharacterized protein (TIGR00369 family)